MFTLSFFFFFNATATTEIYTLSLHDALPICLVSDVGREDGHIERKSDDALPVGAQSERSEEHTSELQSPYDLVCRLLLEKKKKYHNDAHGRRHDTGTFGKARLAEARLAARHP